MKTLVGAALFAAVSSFLAMGPASAASIETTLGPQPAGSQTVPLESESPSADQSPGGVAAHIVPGPQTMPPVMPLVKKHRRGQTDLWGQIIPVGIHNNNYKNGFSVLPPLIVKNGGWPTGAARIASTFRFFGQPLFLELESEQLAVHHRTRLVGLKGERPATVDAGYYREGVVEARAGVQIPRSPVYFGVATYYRSLPGAGSDTDPDLVGAGVGFEAFPDLWKNRSAFGRIYYYPKIETEEPYLNPRTHRSMFLHYSRLSYESGYSVRLGHGNLFAKAAISGDVRRRLNTMPPEAPLTAHSVHLLLGPALRF